MPILSTNQLTKSYGSILAVNALSLEVEKGNIYGILGPNGSGKTTTLGMLLGITNADSGSFKWFDGKYGNNARKNIGALLETPNFYPYMTAGENLEIVAHIRGVKQPNYDRLLEIVNLAHRKKSPFKSYSLGMKQRLGIASCLIGDPEVLIFDEPTNGLDPQGIAEVRKTIKQIAQDGKTILMASHILDEVEKICTHVAIIKNGNLLANGRVGNIINNDITVEVGAEDIEGLRSFIQEQRFAEEIKREGALLSFSMDESFSVRELNQLAFDKGIVLTHLVAKARSLEAEFLEITK